MMDINPADVLAAGDTFGVVSEGSDSLTFEQALEYERALLNAKARLDEALGLVRTQLLKLLDSPRQVGPVLYKSEPDKKFVADHDQVRKRLITIALHDPSTGELLEAGPAVERAWSLMAALYLSPSVEPKKAGLDRLGLAKTEVGDFVPKGRKVTSIVLSEEEP